MNPGATAAWTDFLVAVAGAAGALAGLVFVALSINLVRILELPGVAGRAAETLLLLAGSLLAALLALVPYASPSSLGWLVLAVGLPTWDVPTAIQVQVLRKRRYPRASVAAGRILLHQAATLPFLVAGLALRQGDADGMYWLAAALVLSMIAALIGAWVLLVEIVR